MIGRERHSSMSRGLFRENRSTEAFGQGGQFANRFAFGHSAAGKDGRVLRLGQYRGSTAEGIKRWAYTAIGQRGRRQIESRALFHLHIYRQSKEHRPRRRCQ